MAVKGVAQLAPSKEAQMFVRALQSYSQSPSGLADLLNAAKQTGVRELQTASMQLNKLVASKSGNRVQGAGRFSEKVPTVYPSRSEVLGNLFAHLERSGNPRVKAFAGDIAAAWMQEVQKSVGIDGRYV